MWLISQTKFKQLDDLKLPLKFHGGNFPLFICTHVHVPVLADDTVALTAHCFEVVCYSLCHASLQATSISVPMSNLLLIRNLCLLLVQYFMCLIHCWRNSKERNYEGITLYPRALAWQKEELWKFSKFIMQNMPVCFSIFFLVNLHIKLIKLEFLSVVLRSHCKGRTVRNIPVRSPFTFTFDQNTCTCNRSVAFQHRLDSIFLHQPLAIFNLMLH